MSELSAYFLLFVTAFGAATLLPLQSEIVLVGMLMADRYASWALLLVATTGNVLGSVVNWLLGRSIERFRERRWFPVKHASLDRAQRFYQRVGRWSLLLAWMPFIGDPLTVVAGVMKEPFWRFLLIVTLAKTGRFVALTALTLGWLV